MWAINGVGLALVIPSGQSLIADYYPPASRGRAFGALYLTGAVGGMLGSLYATNMGVNPCSTLHLRDADTCQSAGCCSRGLLGCCVHSMSDMYALHPHGMSGIVLCRTVPTETSV